MGNSINTKVFGEEEGGCEPRWQVWEGKESRGDAPPFLRKVLLPLPNISTPLPTRINRSR